MVSVPQGSVFEPYPFSIPISHIYVPRATSPDADQVMLVEQSLLIKNYLKLLLII